MDKFEVVEKISKNIDYNSRNWNKEIIDRYLLKYDDKRIIESMTIIHLKDDIQKDLTVEISNMYNCVVGCRFCASGSLPENKIFLSPEDYLKQVETCLEESRENPNIDEFLKSHNLEEYDEMEILKVTKAELGTDRYFVEE